MRFTTAIIERYRRRKTSVEEAMSEIPWGVVGVHGDLSNLNEKAFEAVEAWRNRPLRRAYPYVYVDETCLMSICPF